MVDVGGVSVIGVYCCVVVFCIWWIEIGDVDYGECFFCCSWWDIFIVCKWLLFVSVKFGRIYYFVWGGGV